MALNNATYIKALLKHDKYLSNKILKKGNKRKVTKMNKSLFLVLKGIIVGIANIIPGVSGGTIAVVLGIFDEMIEAINHFFKNPKKHISFLLPLVIGAVLGIIILSKVIKFGLENYSLPTNLFFVGLVVGSIPLIFGKATKKHVSLRHYLISFVSFMVVIGFVVFEMAFTDNSNSSVTLHSDLPFLIRLFLGAILASSAMVIPGISGSFVMVLIGMYNYIITAISTFIDELLKLPAVFKQSGAGVAILALINSDSFKILCVVALGVVIGIIVISKIIAFLLEKAHTTTYFCVLGLIFGSIVSILIDSATYQSGVNFGMIVGGIITAILGFFIALKLSKE